MTDKETKKIEEQHLTNAKEDEILNSIKMSRVIIPVLLGLAVVAYMLWSSFDPEEFAKISWTMSALLWIVAALVLVVVRHIAYMIRLRVLTSGFFSWRKCFELIFIWEFSSAVSPTSVGGSAVALFVLAQEKLSAGKTASLIIYTVIVDTIVFIGTLPILYLFFGPNMIRPGLESLLGVDGLGITFIIAYCIMLFYGVVFFYGAIINPIQFKKLIFWVCKLPFLKRFQRTSLRLSNDMVLSSEEIKKQNWKYHLGIFLSTFTAWASRFLILNCLLLAFIPILRDGFTIAEQVLIYGRQVAMYVIMAVSPTPGGAGIAEYALENFLSDYVPIGIVAIIAFIWRILTYYIYLVGGAIVIPNWIRTVLEERRKGRLTK